MNEKLRRRPSVRDRRTDPATATLAFALTASLGLGAATADDTEIFFGEVDGSVGASSNVLFVVDTSKSMRAASDIARTTRLEAMKLALSEIVQTTDDVNLGVMRFNGKEGGSAVIWPLIPLDSSVCVGTACEDTGVSASVADDAGDVEETIASGSVHDDGRTLELGYNGTDARAVGMRFEGLTVPQGATITEAYVDFVASADRSGAAALEIAAEAADDAAVFTASDGEVSGRSLATGVPWTPEDWSRNGSYSSSDIAATIQQVTDRPGWCGGNAITLVVEGSGRRDALSRRGADDPGSLSGIDAATAAAPRLRVSYNTAGIPAGGGCNRVDAAFAIASGDDDAEEDVTTNGKKKPELDSTDLELSDDGGERQLVGLRFDGVVIPAGATIESAWLELVVSEKKSSGSDPLSVLIAGEDDADADPYDADKKGDISKRKRLGTEIPWSDIPVHEVDDVVTSPDIAALIREIVDLGDWVEGNAIGLLIEHVSGEGTRTFESYDGESGSAPTLHVRYRSGTPAGTAVTMDARTRLQEVIEEIDHASGTPIVDALYEAALYMRGEAVDYGLRRGKSSSLLAENRVSHSDSWSGGTLVRPSGCSVDDLNAESCVAERIVGDAIYDSPISSSCQANHVVLLTDGQASSNSAAQKVRDITGTGSCAIDTGVKACGQELAEWLYTEDHASRLDDAQSVTVHTIGFNYSGSWLKSLADKGGGDYYGSTEASELRGVFDEILAKVADVDTSFVAPAATVNQFNRLTHRSDIYFAMFKPEAVPSWSGNLKRYRIGVAGESDEVTITDANGEAAVDETTAFFDDQAKSFWSDVVDGSDVSLGGAASRLDASVLGSGRRVFTFTDELSTLAAGAADLTATEHALHEDNDEVTLEMLGLDPATHKDRDREDLLEWARGVDTLDVDEDGDDSELRPRLGDPMHSRPVLLNYNESAGERSAIYMTTNEGFLHSIDADSGDENYAFIPRELLGNLATLRENDRGDPHPYGLDGGLSAWVDDANGNVAVDPGESARLYAGMRRGGRNYYAFDVSSRTDPKLLWVIEGGTGDFAELGESWSRAVPTRVMHEGESVDVLVFGAGYDTTQDDFVSETSPRQGADGVGRGFYVVRADTGQKLWAVLAPGADGADDSPAEMLHSVPGDIRVIDIDFDGHADQLWFADTGGQVWRFDFAAYHQSGDDRDFLVGGVMADLGGSALGEERRFYHEPDVSMSGRGDKRTLSIAIGSGWRAHPLDESVQDRFYVLRSSAIYEAPEGYGRPRDPSATTLEWRPITDADLVAVDGGLDPATSAYGWYLDLPRSGEKVLGDSLTVNGQVVFTTYRPDPSLDPCSPSIGGGSVYVLDILDGSATVDADGDGDVDDEDRSVDLAHSGIPPEPAALFTQDGSDVRPVMLVGPEAIAIDFENLTRRSYWIEHEEGRPAATTVADGER